jgi:outer membrane immunogenic protein
VCTSSLVSFGISESWFGTVRGRFGYAWDRVLVYGTGGAAFIKQNISACDLFAGCVAANSNITGWTAGAGVEYAFWNN